MAFLSLDRDRDLGIPPTLFSIPNSNGVGERKLVGIGDKDGMYYVMDRHLILPMEILSGLPLLMAPLVSLL